MKTTCPYCNYEATEHETLDDKKNPKEHDISFCINCGEFSVFKDNQLEKVNIEYLDEPTIKYIKQIKSAWLKTNKD